MISAIRSLVNEPRPDGARPIRRWEIVVVALAVLLGVVEAAFEPNVAWRPLAAVLVVLLTPLWLLRRSRPALAVAVTFGAHALSDALTWSADEEYTTMVGVTLLASVSLTYCLTRWGSGREIVWAAPALVVLNISSNLTTEEQPVIAGVVNSTFLLLVLAVGVIFRTRARNRERQELAARLAEREQLARELHDTVAHHVSAIAIQAQAGQLMAARDPEAAAGVLATIEEAATNSLAEMRHLVAALRDGASAELRPGSTIADLEELCAAEGPGPAVSLQVSGAGELPPSIGASVFRIAQEAITNARRHARHATSILVTVVVDGDMVELGIRDDGDVVASGGAAGRSAGYGLVGMAERVELLGGTFEAGPAPGRGWQVNARLPVREHR